MKQRRHPIKNQSEACASVTLQKGLWRRARSLNAGLSSELDVTWHVVFLQHFFGDRQQNSSVGFVDAIQFVLRPPTVSDVWKGAMRGQQSQPIIVSSVFSLVILIAMLVGISQYQCNEIDYYIYFCDASVLCSAFGLCRIECDHLFAVCR